jgi:hypothetical protein
MIEFALLSRLIDQGGPVSAACLDWLLSGAVAGGDERSLDIGWPVAATPL